MSDDVVEQVNAANPQPIVEVGWIVAGRFSRQLIKSVRRARALFAKRLREQFPDFDFRVPLVLKPDTTVSSTVEPTRLLDLAQNEKDLKNWDFGFALTAGDMKGYVRPTLLAAPSAVIGCAAMACGRIWEPCDDSDDADCTKRQIRATGLRLANLATHLLGHLCGLRDRDEPDDFMRKPSSVTELEQMQQFSGGGAETLAEELHDVADPRLEEEDAQAQAAKAPSRFAGALGRARFTLTAAVANYDDVFDALMRAEPWMFPARLSRLTTAAVSTLLVLCMTAEAWEAGMSQPMWRVILISVAAILVTTPFLLSRQQLLIHRPRRRSRHLSEQRSVGNVAITLAVLLGMVTTYAGLLAAALVTTWAFFPDHVVSNWAATVEKPHRAYHYLCLCGSVAAVGLVIGALGASFEPRGYMRHVAFVDEEI